MHSGSTRHHVSLRITPSTQQQFADVLACEEPLEIRVHHPSFATSECRSVAVTMRSPGHDEELALGFLIAEGVIRGPDDVLAVEICPKSRNTVTVRLSAASQFDPVSLERHSFVSSSCGVCGKTSIAALRGRGITSLERFPRPSAVELCALLAEVPEKLRQAQSGFHRSGGLHASGLFDSVGQLQLLREDVGRHNALDKLIGAAFLGRQLPLSRSILLLSGRVSFELVQKAVVAGIPVIAALGAPSTLAVTLAHELGVTLIGFLKADRFNVYCQVNPGHEFAGGHWRDGEAADFRN